MKHETTPRKRNLSLKKNTNKVKNKENQDAPDVVNISSSDDDDEDVVEQKIEVPFFDLTQLSTSTEGSSCSQNTVIYDIATETNHQPKEESKTSSKVLECLQPENQEKVHTQNLDLTPQKPHSLNSPTKTPVYLQNSPQQYLSPTKKRNTSSPITPRKKTKHNLTDKLDDNSSSNVKDEQFTMYEEHIKVETPSELVQPDNRTMLFNEQTPRSLNKREHRTPLKRQPPSTSTSSINSVPKSSSSSGKSLTKTPASLLKSPQKFFSPAKKRNVSTKPVRRNLCEDLDDDTHLLKCVKNENFAVACENMDEKTIFFLTTIHKFLENPALHHLLDSEGHSILNNIMTATKPGSRLVCRLYWRKEGWFKMDKIITIASNNEYEPSQEVGNTSMVHDLLAKGILLQGDDMTFEDLITFLNKSDLMQVCKELNQKAHSKHEAIQVLRQYSQTAVNISHYFTGCTTSNRQRVLQAMQKQAGVCLKLSDKARSTLHRLYLIIYLGLDYSEIREKKLELIQLYDKINRETYPISKGSVQVDDASVVFKTRDAFEQFVEAHNIYEDFLAKSEARDAPNIQEIVKQVYTRFTQIGPDEMARCRSIPIWLRRYTAGYIFTKLLDAGVQELKKDKTLRHCLLAQNVLKSLIEQDVFRQSKKAEWHCELAQILHSSCARSIEAAEVLLQGFKSKMSEEAKDILRPKARKLAVQKNTLSGDLKTELLAYVNREEILEKNIGGIHIHRNPLERPRDKVRGKQKFETRTAQGRIVQDAEECCITHYICTGEYTHGEHWEGRIITTIFFLLFWQIIYTKPHVPGVFLCHYQKFPLDLFTDEFYNNRKREIDSWLELIGESSIEILVQKMQDTWNSRPEYEISGITRSIDWECVSAVATRLGPRGLRAVCSRLATNYAHNHSGFPDLTLWNENNLKLKFVEVKTDSDKPSLKQLQWMWYMKQHKIPTEFCYVGVNTARQKSRRAASDGGNSRRKPCRKPKTKSNATKASQSTIQATQSTSKATQSTCKATQSGY